MYFLKIFPTIFAKNFIQFIFFMSCLLFKVDLQKVTFASYRAEELEGNLYFIYKELHEKYPHYSCNFLFKKYKSSFLGKFYYLVHMVRASYELATSRLFIIDDFYFPVYVIKPRKGTEIIQLWHAAGAFKKFGLSTVNKSFGPSSEYLKHVKVHSNYSKVFVSSSEVVPFYAEAFDMPANRIFPFGIPRTDYLFNSKLHESLRERLKSQFPDLKDKKLILYAPTFRGKSHYQESFKIPMDFSSMKQRLGNDYALLIHLHPYMRTDIQIKENEKDFVYHIKDQFDIQQLLVLTDILITDYSSVIFDYSLLVRPVVFLANDLEDYIKERDFYYDFMSFIPGPYFSESDSLVSWIEEGKFDLTKVEKFRNRFFDYFDGKTSERIVKCLLEGKNDY